MRTRTRTAITVAALAAASALVFGVAGAGATQGQAVLAGLDNVATDNTLVVQTGQVSLSDCQSFSFFTDGLTACGGTGVAAKGTGWGVYGDGGSTGVQGSGPTGVRGDGTNTGVLGSALNGGTGVFGTHIGSTGIGVHGKTGGTGSGVYGEATANGAGVFGDSTTGIGLQGRSTSGPALNVLGKAKFSRSGITTIAAGTASKNVTMSGVTGNSMVFAMAQQNPGVYVKAAIPASGSFTIYLTGNAPGSGLKVAYFVLN